MLFAAIGDIRGNLPALDRVLLELADEGIQTIVNTGDSVVGGASVKGVLDALEAHGVTSVQGELDRALVRFQRKQASLRKKYSDQDFAALEAAYSACTSGHIEYLRSLPRTALAAVDGIEIAICHGSLTSQRERLEAESSDEIFKRQRELTPARIIVCGHGTDAFVRWVDDALFVHPGSVGFAADCRAHFAIVSTEREPWDAELRQVDYDSV